MSMRKAKSDDRPDVDVHSVGKKVGLEIWRVNAFKLEEVPKEQHGAFFSGDCYVILNTKNLDEWDIHFWLGRDASQDERGVAAIKAVEIDNALGGFPVQYREVQAFESPLFLSYFNDGIRYMQGGYQSGYRHVEEMFAHWKPQLFHCKGKRNIRCYQVECIKESLNEGDVFILDLGKDIYVWMPPESGRLERIKAMTRAKNMAEHERHGESKVHILDEDWKSNATFWSYFGGKDVQRWIKGAKNDDEDYWKENNVITLWKVSDATGKMNVAQIASGEIPQKLLDSKDAFILDAGKGGVFVWIGKDCTMEERDKAMEIGAHYLEKRKLPDFTTLSRVLETAEPASFTQWFGDWTGAKKKKAFEPSLYQVSDETGKLVMEEIANYDQECLDGDDVMLLDTLNTIYVWVGANANKNEKSEAENTAKKFLEQSQLPRNKKATIETIFQGQENPTFKKYFPAWDDKLFKRDARSVANMRKLLFK